MGRKKIVKAKYGDKYFPVVATDKLLKHLDNECLMIFPQMVGEKRKKANMFFGIGIVWSIRKGENFDIISINFGNRFTRDVILEKNMVRRQLYTCKRGQYASVFGYIIGYTDMENGMKQIRLYGRALQGWYTPKNLDIKHYEEPDKIDKVSQEDIDMEHFLDQFKELD